MKENKIKISVNKTIQIKDAIKEFLSHKAKLDNDIRSYNVNESDAYKELLLEEHLSGMLIALKLLKINYRLDEKQLGLEIESELQEEIDNPQEQIKEILLNIKNEMLNSLNIINQTTENNIFEEEEKNLHKNYYLILGLITILNKLGIKIYLSNIDKNNDIPIMQQIYVDKEEIEDYISMNEKANELTEIKYTQFNLEKSYEILNWKNILNKKFKKINDALINKQENFEEAKDAIQIENRDAYLNEENKDIINLLAELQEKLITLKDKHKKVLTQYVTELFN